MRKIEFRGKLVHSLAPQAQAGTWIYGGFYHWKQGACIYEKNARIGLYVARATVGQYTGLNDNKGVKIFEGDILKMPGSDDQTIIDCAPVVFWHGCFMANFTDNYEYLDHYAFEVIGNIHDNPELLEVAE